MKYAYAATVAGTAKAANDATVANPACAVD